jgi:hypothetical protein
MDIITKDPKIEEGFLFTASPENLLLGSLVVKRISKPAFFHVHFGYSIKICLGEKEDFCPLLWPIFRNRGVGSNNILGGVSSFCNCRFLAKRNPWFG